MYGMKWVITGFLPGCLIFYDYQYVTGKMKNIQLIEEEALEHNVAIKKAILSGESQVQKFYDDAVVFLTGGSGFLGKQLIEKLLRSCNVNKIYILIRSKKGKTADQRLQAILEDPVYEELRKDKPNFTKKLVPIEGDTTEVNLGIDDKDWSRLADEVDIILHAAATTNFNDTFKTATLTNVRGTREMLSLARTCKHLKSVVHVSTAYAHATLSRLEGEVNEEVYSSPIPPDALIQLAENIDVDKLNAMIEPISQDWPNSYTFSKAVAEQLVRVQGQGLPVCIVRPAIVISAYREPLLGWVDVKNAFGPSGLVVGIALGVIHTVMSKAHIDFDCVPVDIVNNVTIVAAKETFTRYTEGDKQTVVYTVTGTRKPLKLGKVCKILNADSRELVPTKTIWYCFGYSTQYKLLYTMLMWLLHYIPAVIIDGISKLIGEKPRFLNIYKKISSLSSAFEYFLTNCWIFGDANTLELHNKLSDTDKLIYNCDMSSVDMEELVLVWFYGVVKYIIKDDKGGSPYALKKQFWLKIAHYIIFPLYLYTICKIISMFFEFVYNIFM